MQYEGQIIFEAPRASLFELLVDGEALAPCVPGLQSFEVVEPGKSFKLTAKSKFGTIEPELDLQVTFTLIEPPDCARLRIRGRGAASHVGASSYITLLETEDGGTAMNWSFTFSVFGQLASIGNRVLNQAFDQLHREFIRDVQELATRRFPRP
ncbi:MAG: SRPBCC domain-containing protein [Acidobacteriota bacterium]